MQSCRNKLAALLCLVLVLQGATPPDAALEVVKETLGAAQGVVNGDASRDEKLFSLRDVARDILDTEAMGRHAIGETLVAQPPEQQEEYFELFDHVIVRAYLSKLLLFRKPRFGYRSSRIEGDKVIVRSRIITENDEFAVDYHMLQRDGRWVAADVVVEGMSLSDNYRTQFSSLLRGRSFEELLELMRRKTRVLRKGPV